MTTTNETLTWHHQPGQLPDAELTVMVSALMVTSDRETWPGFWDGEHWCWADGMRVRGLVKAWAEMPVGVA